MPKSSSLNTLAPRQRNPPQIIPIEQAFQTFFLKLWLYSAYNLFLSVSEDVEKMLAVVTTIRNPYMLGIQVSPKSSISNTERS